MSLTHTDNIAKKWLWITVAGSHHGLWSHCFNFPTRDIDNLWLFPLEQRQIFITTILLRPKLSEEYARWTTGGSVERADCRNKLLKGGDQYTAEAVLMLDSLTFWLEVPLISCSHFFSFLLCLCCVNMLSIFQSEWKEKEYRNVLFWYLETLWKGKGKLP